MRFITILYDYLLELFFQGSNSRRSKCEQIHFQLHGTEPQNYEGTLIGNPVLCFFILTLNLSHQIWVFPKIMVPQYGWFIMVPNRPNPIKMDDLGVLPQFFPNFLG